MFGIRGKIATRNGEKIPFEKDYNSKFRKIKLLGKGTFSKVWLTEYKETGDLYAFKETIISKDEPEDTFFCLKNEIKNSNTMAEVTHCVPKYYTYFCYRLDYNYILVTVTEYINGKTLNSCVNIDIYSLIYWMKMIIDNLYLHNIVHRDIKCENIIYDDIQNKFYLIDFGFSINTNNIDKYDIRTLTKGTPYYFSPNMALLSRGCIKYTNEQKIRILEEGDIWCMGMTVYNYIHDSYPYIETDDCYTLFKEITDMNHRINTSSSDEYVQRFISFVLNKYNVPTPKKFLEFII